jgi:hypothetical protein
VQTYVIIKTQLRQYRDVLRRQKHATDEPPILLGKGDIVLIHREGTGRTVPPMVTHAMDCVRIYRDTKGESLAIWGRSWKYIIEGSNLRPLPKPIPISRFGRASGKNYGKGAQKFVYVESADLEDLRAEGLL